MALMWVTRFKAVMLLATVVEAHVVLVWKDLCVINGIYEYIAGKKNILLSFTASFSSHLWGIRTRVQDDVIIMLTGFGSIWVFSIRGGIEALMRLWRPDTSGVSGDKCAFTGGTRSSRCSTRILLRQHSSSRWRQDRQSGSCCCRPSYREFRREEEPAGTAWAAGPEEDRSIDPGEEDTVPGEDHSWVEGAEDNRHADPGSIPG